MASLKIDEIDRIGACMFENILAAKKRLLGYAHVTPVMVSRTLNRMVGGEVFFKCENFQRMGAFKIRGAAHLHKTLYR